MIRVVVKPEGSLGTCLEECISLAKKLNPEESHLEIGITMEFNGVEYHIRPESTVQGLLQTKSSTCKHCSGTGQMKWRGVRE